MSNTNLTTQDYEQWLANPLTKALKASHEQKLKDIVNLLMIQHEAANGAHNYWKVAAQLIQADVASDT